MPLAAYHAMLESARGCQLTHLEDLSDSETNHFLDTTASSATTIRSKN
jgi:hypothetical protein